MRSLRRFPIRTWSLFLTRVISRARKRFRFLISSWDFPRNRGTPGASEWKRHSTGISGNYFWIISGPWEPNSSQRWRLENPPRNFHSDRASPVAGNQSEIQRPRKTVDYYLIWARSARRDRKREFLRAWIMNCRRDPRPVDAPDAGRNSFPGSPTCFGRGREKLWRIVSSWKDRRGRTPCRRRSCCTAFPGNSWTDPDAWGRRDAPETRWRLC